MFEHRRIPRGGRQERPAREQSAYEAWWRPGGESGSAST